MLLPRRRAPVKNSRSGEGAATGKARTATNEQSDRVVVGKIPV